MNTESPSNGASEIKRLFTKNYKTLSTPPPFLSEIRRHCALWAQDNPCSFPFTLKCALVCFALAFSVFAGNTYAQDEPDEPVILTCETYTPEMTDLDTLVALYCATDGPNWEINDYWMEVESKGDFSRWEGTEVNIDSQVMELRLSNNGLSGTIPPELGNLTLLEILYLGSNELSGTIPSELGNLTLLRALYLGSNELSGAIPPELGNLTLLEYLYLNENELSGTIPPELGNLSSLEELHVSDNQLSGTIPPELGKLISQKYLRLHGNELSGTIPTELGNLSSLEELYLHENELSGAIPPELGNLTIQYLHLYDNALSGTIPTELANLTRLWDLRLSQNQLSGTIPTELGNLTRLRDLRLSQNRLSGAIPSGLSALTNVTNLELNNNRLSFDIPDLGPLTQLVALKLQNNQQLGGELYDNSLADSLSTLDIRCTNIQTPGPTDWLNGITDFQRGCSGTGGRGSPPSPTVSPREPEPVEPEPVEPEPVEPEPVEPVPPPESPQGDEGGGCAIASNAGAGETSKGIVLNLILVMSALLVIPWRNHSGAKKT